MVPVLASLMVPYIFMIMVLGTLQPQDSESASPFHHGPIWSPLPSIIIPIAAWSLPPLQPHDLQSLQSPASWCPIPTNLDMVPGLLPTSSLHGPWPSNLMIMVVVRFSLMVLIALQHSPRPRSPLVSNLMPMVMVDGPL